MINAALILNHLYCSVALIKIKKILINFAEFVKRRLNSGVRPGRVNRVDVSKSFFLKFDKIGPRCFCLSVIAFH